MTAAALPVISSDQYRREARRLRCRYAGRPDRLQRSLKTLATRIDRPALGNESVWVPQVGVPADLCSCRASTEQRSRSTATCGTRSTKLTRYPAVHQDTPAPASFGPVRISSGAAATFAQRLAEEIPSNGVLTYSARLRLLREAQVFGIGRFEANLLIAAGLQRKRHTVTTPQLADDAIPHTFSRVAQLMTFLLIQGAFALGAWWTFFR